MREFREFGGGDALGIGEPGAAPFEFLGEFLRAGEHGAKPVGISTRGLLDGGEDRLLGP